VVQTPPPRDPPRRSFVAGVIIGLVVAGLSAAVIYLLATRNTSTTASMPSPSATATPSPSPSPSSPVPPPPEGFVPQVRVPFSSQDWAKGERVWLGVADLGLHVKGCVVHTYRLRGKTYGAYETGCSSWENDGYDIILFHVDLWNKTRRAISFNLRDFVLTARDDRTFGPVNVRSKAEFPPNFLPENGKLLPRTRLSGYLTFDGRVTGLVAAGLSYVDGKQTISIEFDGKHRARR
jgi:hypothetical protein